MIYRKTPLALHGGRPIHVGTWPQPHERTGNEKKYLLDVLENQTNWSHGRFSERFEKEFASYLETNFVKLTPNASLAFKLILQGLAIKNGDVILIPSITWQSIAWVIIELGAIPITVDVDEHFGISIESLETQIESNSHVKAIVATHLFGSHCKIEEICKIAEKHRISVIEDTVHVPGTTIDKKKLGTFGVAGIMSFNQKKLISAGEGGCVITSNERLIERIKRIHEIKPDQNLEQGLIPSTNKISEFQAAVLLAKLENFDSLIQEQQSKVSFLRNLLKDFSEIEEQKQHSNTSQSYYNLCFRILGMTPERFLFFRTALSKELNLGVNTIYTPMHIAKTFSAIRKAHSGIDNGLKTIHPVAYRYYLQEAFRFGHHILEAKEEDLAKIPFAIEKVLSEIYKQKSNESLSQHVCTKEVPQPNLVLPT